MVLSDRNYGKLHDTVVDVLRRSLGVTHDNAATSGSVGGDLLRMERFHAEGALHQRDVEVLRLALLVKHLSEIHGHDVASGSDLMTEYAMRLTRGNLDNYFGTRCEISTAASFVRNNVRFLRPEGDSRIDFTLDEYGHAAVECTSAHVIATQGRPLLYKIESAIRVKSEKPYGSRHAALFIDATNLMHHDSEELLTGRELRPALTPTVEAAKWGSILVFFHVLDYEKAKYQFNYIRVDNGDIGDALASFLDRVYPRGRLLNRYYVIPESG